MKRGALLLLVASACLEPGGSLYERSDTTPPRVLFELMSPPILGSDGGFAIPLSAGETIKLPFSEAMDESSLRPGIAVRIFPDRNEIPLLIFAPPPGTIPYEVRISSPEVGGFRSATYSMQLRTLLIDVAGNPIADGPELTGFFRVP